MPARAHPQSIRGAAYCALVLCAFFSTAVLGQQSSTPISGGYPLNEVLNGSYSAPKKQQPVPPIDPTPALVIQADPPVYLPAVQRAIQESGPRLPGNAGISPEHWGENSWEAVPQDECAAQVEARDSWNWDPPANEPEPTPYELRTKEKKHSPNLQEILNKGRYFGAVEAMWMEPHFLGSTALTETTAGSVVAEPFDFGFSFSPRFTGGFESELGPGIGLRYWNFDDNSSIARMTSDGVTVGQASIYLMGPERWTRLSADAAGETLTAVHQLDAQSFEVFFFKDIEFKVSRLNGFLGLQYATMTHRMDAQVTDGGGAVVGSLLGQSEFEGFGPTIGIEYFRPIGHTKLEMLGGIQISVMVGERDQLASNSSNLDFNLFSADELLSGLNGHLGVQYMHHLTEHRTLFARTTFETQHWIGGGTATNPSSDFGLYGLTFGVGLNR